MNVRQIFFGNKLPFMLLKQLLNYTVHAIFELCQFMLLNQPIKLTSSLKMTCVLLISTNYLAIAPTPLKNSCFATLLK